MWAFGDINAIANLDPLRWSSYMCLLPLVCELHKVEHDKDNKENKVRPVHIKDEASGDWRFETFEFALTGIRNGDLPL